MTRGEKTGNLHRRTSLAGGHMAGAGITYDDYSEESGGWNYGRRSERVRLPNDGVKPEDMNGPVICYKGEKRKDMAGLLPKDREGDCK